MLKYDAPLPNRRGLKVSCVGYAGDLESLLANNAEFLDVGPTRNRFS